MTHETSQDPANNDQPIALFGTQLIAAREAMGLERKDIANQLRLSESIVSMMEHEQYANDLPVTFIRGYLRAYAKFLQIPEADINKALQAITPKPTPTNVIPLSSRNLDGVSNDYYFMHIFSYLIGITIIALLGTWAYTHYSPNNKIVIESAINNVENVAAKFAIKPLVPTDIAGPRVNSPTTMVKPQLAERVAEGKTLAMPEKEKVIKPAKTNSVRENTALTENEDEEGYSDESDTANAE
jgi:cytoskeleton protein RodZ